LACLLLAAAFVVQPVLRPPAVPMCSSPRIIMQSFADDGADVDWDEEAKKLGALAKPMNKYYKAVSDIAPPKLVAEFAQTAPPEVQFAVKATVASLLGTMPEGLVESQKITTTGKNLASLMFNMQMTGYMFRNAEYRRTLGQSLERAIKPASDEAPTALPPVSGSITVNIAEGMQAQVDAAAYMSELRQEVEGLRAELAAIKKSENTSEEGALISYIQKLPKDDQQQLTSSVGPDVLEAMSQLVATILIDLNIERDMETAAPLDKVKELLIWQLISGYTLREMEVRDELKDKYWGVDATDAE